MLCEYNGSGVFQQWYAYGNYIDEVLMMGTTAAPTSARFYIHDHLYSPAALTTWTGTILERYEYDAYGNCYVLEPNFAPDSDGESNYGNPYLFTGRRVDILDSGSLKIQYNRNRYYDYYTGRWLTHDPLGIIPNPQKPNIFDLIALYKDGMNLYKYAKSLPILGMDAYGLCVRPPSSIVSADAVISQAQDTQDKADELYDNWIGILIPPSPLEVAVQQLFRVYYLARKFDPGISGIGDAPSNRFVYTCKGGWIDVGHYYYTAGAAYTRGGFYRGLGLSYILELSQLLASLVDPKAKFFSASWGESAFTPEDLYSNALGASAGGTMRRNVVYFWKGALDLVSRLKEDLDKLGPVDPDRKVAGVNVRACLELGAEFTCSNRHYWPTPVKMPLYHDCVCDESGNPK